MRGIVWEKGPDLGTTRGFLDGEPETTMFLIQARGRRFKLNGAFIPDAEESRTFATVAKAQNAADRHFKAWFDRHRGAFVKLLARCYRFIPPNFGRDTPNGFEYLNTEFREAVEAAGEEVVRD
jgi:hypothetical protein